MAATSEVAAAVTVLLTIVLALAAASSIGTGAGEIGCRIGVFQPFADETSATVTSIVATRVLRAATFASPAVAMVTAGFTVPYTEAGERIENASGKTTQDNATRCGDTNDSSKAIELLSVHHDLPH